MKEIKFPLCFNRIACHKVHWNKTEKIFALLDLGRKATCQKSVMLHSHNLSRFDQLQEIKIIKSPPPHATHLIPSHVVIIGRFRSRMSKTTWKCCQTIYGHSTLFLRGLWRPWIITLLMPIFLVRYQSETKRLCSKSRHVCIYFIEWKGQSKDWSDIMYRYIGSVLLNHISWRHNGIT